MNIKLVILFFITSILLPLNICFSQNTKPESLSILIVYGAENYYNSKAQEFVANKWDIKVYRIVGITVDQKIADSVATVNSSLWKKLDSTLHKGSEKVFRKEVVSEMEKILKAQRIYDANKKLKRAIRKIEDKNTKTYSDLKYKEDDLTYIYIIKSYDIANTDVQSTNLKVTVNIENETVHIKNLVQKTKIRRSSIEKL
ncbi:hypothetical protein [uncultured Dokdonia sp.]|uniref:hypothetical protein n=1 Tax=uncultured Dokdonia sp. TaxID=575653 RepID=UPI00260D6FA3|nr:hypothetical protein [uncultured Dokdonia sp.]